jgi:hypothetical protein
MTGHANQTPRTNAQHSLGCINLCQADQRWLVWLGPAPGIECVPGHPTLVKLAAALLTPFACAGGAECPAHQRWPPRHTQRSLEPATLGPRLQTQDDQQAT